MSELSGEKERHESTLWMNELGRNREERLGCLGKGLGRHGGEKM